MGINSICLEGQLVSPFKQIQKENVNFGVITYVAKLNKNNKFINVLIFNGNLFLYEKAKKYLIDANKGKRLCVAGKVSFDNLDKLQIIANDIDFIDKFVDQDTLDNNKVEFDENELPWTRYINE